MNFSSGSSAQAFRKEVETMRTRTENDVRKFNEALDRCRRPVFLVSADGTQYNMKSANDYYAGMGPLDQ